MLRVRNIIRNLIKDYALGWRLPNLYKKYRDQPVDQRKVIFLEGKLDEVPHAFSVIMPALEARDDYDVHFIALGQTQIGMWNYFKRSKALMTELASAQYVFLEDASSVVSCVGMRPETKVIQLWHACGAFKKFGMSVADKKFGGSRKDKQRHPFYKNLSLVTVSSPEVLWAYIEAMELGDTPEIVQPLGVSSTDKFFQEGFVETARSTVERAFPACVGKHIVLYAPTFRGTSAAPVTPDALDVDLLCKRLGDEWVLLIAYHPYIKQVSPLPDGCKGFAFNVQNKVATDVLLAAVDVLITDYSSVVFEFSLLERPMVFFAYDIDDYNDWRGFYYDYDELTPGPVVQTTEEIAAYLEHLDSRFDKQEVRAFRDKFMSACDGHATERILANVMPEVLS